MYEVGQQVRLKWGWGYRGYMFGFYRKGSEGTVLEIVPTNHGTMLVLEMGNGQLRVFEEDVLCLKEWMNATTEY